VESNGLALAPTYIGDKLIMTCNKRLSPWVIVRLLPNMRQVIVGRFCTRSDADGHLQVLQRLLPKNQMVVVFDVDE